MNIDITPKISLIEQIDNLSNEILEEKLWEEYADLSLHEEFFAVHQLLYDAFEGTAPDGVRGISMFLVPKFLLDENGEPFKLSDYRGKVVLLYFWMEI